MKTFQKNIATVSVLTVLALGLTSCSANTPASNETPNSSTPSASPIAGTEPATVTVLGDFVTQLDAEGNLVTREDSLGTYALVTINPDDESLVLDKTQHDSTIAEAGWTDEDILSAQKWVVEFAVEQGLDSIALDTDDGWERWKTEEASKYLAPEWMSMVESEEDVSENSDRSAMIFNNPNGNQPNLVREEGARLDKGEISVTKVSAFDIEQTGLPAIVFNLSASVSYRISDEEYLKSYKESNPDSSEEEILAQLPDLADGKSQALPPVVFEFTYAVEKVGDTWGLVGFDNSWDTTPENDS
jgi:hypothetical protein